MEIMIVPNNVKVLYFSIFIGFVNAAFAQTPAVVWDAEGWPVVFELKCGEEYQVHRNVSGTTMERCVRLISCKESTEPDLWIEANKNHRTLCDAKVVIEVNGVRAVLHARPYQPPSIINGLRIYVEATKSWANQVELAPLGWHGGDVRFSAVAEGESWGPAVLRFPIQNFRWRSSPYNNTWLSLVPYNKLYYHRGEDFGAVSGRLPVIAMLDGKVIKSPLPNGDGDSNLLIVEHASGLKYQYAHMDSENVDPKFAERTNVCAGDILGKTGMTWSGRKSQTHDHHLHTDFFLGDTQIASYPFIVEAYLRDYPDPVLAIAGGYAFGLPRGTIHLDALRSIARKGERISSYTWLLHDGRRVNTAECGIQYDRPGLYSEELIVRTDRGDEDRDYLQVRIYNPERPSPIIYGWFYHFPLRDILPNTNVEMHNNLINAKAVSIDFGDGSSPQKINETANHVYEKPGIYSASLRSTSEGGEPAEVRMRVVVEDADRSDPKH